MKSSKVEHFVLNSQELLSQPPNLNEISQIEILFCGLLSQ
jgi:hypothetical protein